MATCSRLSARTIGDRLLVRSHQVSRPNQPLAGRSQAWGPEALLSNLAYTCGMFFRIPYGRKFIGFGASISGLSLAVKARRGRLDPQNRRFRSAPASRAAASCGYEARDNLNSACSSPMWCTVFQGALRLPSFPPEQACGKQRPPLAPIVWAPGRPGEALGSIREPPRGHEPFQPFDATGHVCQRLLPICMC